VEPKAEALLATVDDDTPVNSDPVTSKRMLPVSFQMISCAFNIIIQSLFWAWSLPGTLEESKNHNSAEARQGARIFPKFMSDQPLVHCG
jgi:hypothetical protein